MCNLYYLFRDSPAGRENNWKHRISPLGGEECFTRWLKSVKCLDRGIALCDNIKKFAEEAKLFLSKPASCIKVATQDPLKCKMVFMKTIAGICQLFQQRFQTEIIGISW